RFCLHAEDGIRDRNVTGVQTCALPISAGTSNDPVTSGLIGMMGTFIDTLIICSMTGLAIICSGVWSSGLSGAALSSAAFETALRSEERRVGKENRAGAAGSSMHGQCRT